MHSISVCLCVCVFECVKDAYCVLYNIKHLPDIASTMPGKCLDLYYI